MEQTNLQDVAVVMCDAELIEEMKLAVDAERLPHEFTTADALRWMEREAIKKLDGSPYPPLTRDLLLNYSKHTPITKKRKKKVLYSSPNGKVFAFHPL